MLVFQKHLARPDSLVGLCSGERLLKKFRDFLAGNPFLTQSQHGMLNVLTAR